MLSTVTHHSLRTTLQGTRGQSPAPGWDLPSTTNSPRTMAGPPGGERTEALLEPLPQGQVQRHAGIGYELVQALDAPVLQMVEQLPDVHHFFASCLPIVAEQVIDVPKIILENISSRRFCREPQLAEQLVEVPTVQSPSFIRMLQNVDTPVPHGGRGASGGLQGFLPGFSAPVERTVDIPAHRSGVRRLQGFLPEQSATAFGEANHRSPASSVEQIVDNPGSGRGLLSS